MIYNYPGYQDCESFCNLYVTVNSKGAAFVVCSEHPDNPGTSVTNRAEGIATQLCSENALIDPLQLIWIEHYPKTIYKELPKTPASWSRVTFEKYDPNTKRFDDPSWMPINQEQVDALHAQLLNNNPTEMLETPKDK